MFALSSNWYNRNFVFTSRCIFLFCNSIAIIYMIWLLSNNFAKLNKCDMKYFSKIKGNKTTLSMVYDSIILNIEPFILIYVFVFSCMVKRQLGKQAQNKFVPWPRESIFVQIVLCDFVYHEKLKIRILIKTNNNQSVAYTKN